MTAVGKILVFLNLVFSVVVGAFVIMIYLARTHWVDEYKRLDQRLQVAQASEETYKKEAIKAQQDAEGRVAAEAALRKKIEADLQFEIAANTQLRTEKENLNKKSTQQNAVASLSVTEVQKRQEDVAKLRATLKEADKINNDLVKKNNDLIEQATSATIERKAFEDRNNQLVKQLAQMQEDMARQRANRGGTATARAGGKNPPPDNVEGLVKTTDSSGLMTITIGSDAGLTEGHTLEVFRLSPIASQSKYLGTIRILKAGPKEAVAQPISRMTAPPKAGDWVASRILGS